MNVSCPSIRTRVVAKATLFLWLLGFVVGVANACLPEIGHDHQGQAHAAAALATDAAEDCDTAVGDQACRGLRDPELGALVKANVLDGADNVPALGLGAPWRVFAAAPSPQLWRPWAAPPPGPPVAILFLRLTL